MGKDCQCTGRSRNCSCGAKEKEANKEKHGMKFESRIANKEKHGMKFESRIANKKEASKEKPKSYLMKTELKPKSRLEMISYETNPRQSKRIDMIKTEDKRDVRVPVDYYKKKAKK